MKLLIQLGFVAFFVMSCGVTPNNSKAVNSEESVEVTSEGATDLISSGATQPLPVQPSSSDVYKVVFSPPWQITGHLESVLDSSIQDRIRQQNVDYYQIWFQHLTINQTSAYFSETFVSGCSRAEIRDGNCRRFRDAIKAINRMGAKVSVEVAHDYELNLMERLHPNAGNHRNCYSQSQQQAKDYGREVARRHFDAGYGPWVKQGGRIDHVTLDGWVHKITRGLLYDNDRCGFASTNLSAIATANYAKRLTELLNAHGQNVRFSIGVNFPNWRYRGTPAFHNQQTPDYALVMDELVRAIQREGLSYLSLVIDNPHNYYVVQGDLSKTNQSIRRIDRLIEQAESKNLEISYITNVDDLVGKNLYGGGHISPDHYPLIDNAKATQDYKNFSYVYQDTLKQRYGSRIDRFFVQSWHTAPYHYNDMLEMLYRFKRASRSYARKTPANQACSYNEYFTRRPDVASVRGYLASFAREHYQNNGFREEMCRPVY